MLGSQSILHIDHAVVRLPSDALAELVVLAMVVKNPAAAMEVDKCGRRFALLRQFGEVEVDFDCSGGVSAWNGKDFVGMSDDFPLGHISDEADNGAIV